MGADRVRLDDRLSADALDDDGTMAMDVNYSEVNARGMGLLLSIKKHTSSIDVGLKSLVELRVSQINGCAYCVDLHSNESRAAGESQQRLDCLPVWRESRLFSVREMAALSWAESVTNISAEPDMTCKLRALREHFSDTEAVDLTLIVSLMNALNRMSISFGETPTDRSA